MIVNDIYKRQNPSQHIKNLTKRNINKIFYNKKKFLLDILKLPEQIFNNSDLEKFALRVETTNQDLVIILSNTLSEDSQYGSHEITSELHLWFSKSTEYHDPIISSIEGATEYDTTKILEHECLDIEEPTQEPEAQEQEQE